MDSTDLPSAPDADLNQVTSGSVEKMKNRRKQKFNNQPKKVKVFKNVKKFKLNKSTKCTDLKSKVDLNDKLTNKLNNKFTNHLSDKLNEKEINVKEVVAVAANLLLKSIANQTAHKTKCNLLTNKQIKLSKDKLGEAKFNCPNNLTINHQPLIAMFGQNSNEKIEESISLNLKESDADKLNDKFNNDKFNNDKFVNCKHDDHNNCLNSNETHQIVISLLERLIDQQQNATNQLMQLNQSNQTTKKQQPTKSLRKRNDRRKRLNKIKDDLNGLKMVKNFV